MGFAVWLFSLVKTPRVGFRSVAEAHWKQRTVLGHHAVPGVDGRWYARGPLGSIAVADIDLFVFFRNCRRDQHTHRREEDMTVGLQPTGRTLLQRGVMLLRSYQRRHAGE